MRIWVSSPSIEWNGYVYLREHMEIPTELLWLEWRSQKLTISFHKFCCLLWTKILPFPCMMVKFGRIHYAGNMLIRHLCEHDSNILFTSAFKMAELYRFIQICPHVTSKKNHSFLFSVDRSKINLYLYYIMNIFFALRIFRKMQYRPLLLFTLLSVITDNQKIHESLSYRVQSL